MAEKRTSEGLIKPNNLEEANALDANIKEFLVSCETQLKKLNGAADAANKMTTHKDADVEVAELKGRSENVKKVADEHYAKVETLVKEWRLLDNTVTELKGRYENVKKVADEHFAK